MNLSRANDERHLYPLLDFLRFLTYQGREHLSQSSGQPSAVGHNNDPALRLPRRFNGSTNGLRVTAPDNSAWEASPLIDALSAPVSVSAEKSLEVQPTAVIPSASAGTIDILNDDSQINFTSASGEESDLDSASMSSSIGVNPPLLRGRKRSRDECLPTVPYSHSGSLDCLFVTNFHNGVANAQYLDIPLSEFGAELLTSAPKLRRSEGQKLLGQACCYLLLGSSRVVTGTIVDTGVANVQVLSDARHDLPLRWVELSCLYKAPVASEQFQEMVTQRYSTELQQLATSRASQP